MKVIKSSESWNFYDNKDNFEWLLFKSQRTREKLARLSTFPLRKVLVTSDFHHIELNNFVKEQLVCLRESEFISLANEPSLVYLFNSNIGYIGPERFIQKAVTLNNCIIIVQDNDNHHWHEMTSIGLRYSDIYIPAHPVNHPWYDMLSSHILRGRCGGSLFSNLDFITSNRDLFERQRTDGPYGPHYKYEQFTFRNSVIESLHKWFPNVFLRLRHSMEPIPLSELISDWTSYKTHWIVPVGGDIPFRFFDALCTGGIPIIPSYYKHYLSGLGVLEENYSTYTLEDLENPIEIVSEAVAKFDASSPSERAISCSMRFSFASVLLKNLSDIELFVKSHSLLEGQPSSRYFD